MRSPKKLKKIDIFFLVVLTFSAFLLRIDYLNATDIINPIRADASRYVTYAYNLSEYGVFSREASPTPQPDSLRSPGFPLLLSLAFDIGGDKGFYNWALFFQALMGSLVVPLTYLLSRLLLPRWGSILTSMMVFLSPHLIAMSSYLLTETMFSLTLIAALTCHAYAYKKKKLILFLLSGLLFGTAYLTNEIALFIPPIVALITYIYSRRTTDNSTPLSSVFIGLGLLVFLLFPTGWMLRNAINVLPGSASGYNRALSTLSHGAYPDFMFKTKEFKYFPYQEDPDQPYFSSSIPNFLEVLNRRFQKRPLRYISWYLFEKPYYLWSWSILQGQGDIYVYPVEKSLFTEFKAAAAIKTIMKISHFVWMALCFMGLFALFYQRNCKTTKIYPYLLFSMLVYPTIIYTIFAPWPRYAIPFRPFFFIAGTWSLLTLITIYREKFKSKPKENTSEINN